MKNQRKTYLINPPFQLRISIYISLMLLFSSIIYPITIYEIIDQMVLAMSKLLPEMSAGLAEKRSSLLITLSLWQIGFTALIFIICIFVTHRISGPIFKMTAIFRRISLGQEEIKPVTFRKGDFFPELASEYSNFVAKITSDVSYNKEQITSAVHKLNHLLPSQSEEHRILIKEVVDTLNMLKTK